VNLYLVALGSTIYILCCAWVAIGTAHRRLPGVKLTPLDLYLQILLVAGGPLTLMVIELDCRVQGSPKE